MVHFDFIVDDIDAENIMDAVHSEMCRCLAGVTNSMADGKTAYERAYRDKAEYYKELKAKMKNERVKDDYNA